ncbi:hypothetical protein MTO96_004940 [Rhipicephalus appendiculatus]
MALFPLLYRDSWGPSELARRLFNDDFGQVLLDGELFEPPFFHQRFYVAPSNRGSSNASQALAQQGSAVACTPDKFAINVDTRHFAPEEITVKTQDNCVVIHGKHEEKSDDRGCYIKREFTRRYVLPEGRRPRDGQVSAQSVGLPFPRSSPQERAQESGRREQADPHRSRPRIQRRRRQEEIGLNQKIETSSI